MGTSFEDDRIHTLDVDSWRAAERKELVAILEDDQRARLSPQPCRSVLRRADHFNRLVNVHVRVVEQAELKLHEKEATSRLIESLFVDQADALLIVTEWKEFRNPDFDGMKAALKQPLVFDGRNIYDPALMRSLGIEYTGIGRGHVPQSA